VKLHSYVVRYDSGFAPNPFYGYCTLVTCKPSIRKGAAIGDWVVGCGSNDRTVRRGGYLVYAMRVTEAISFDTYAADPRFARKVPYRTGSRKQSCGDNIYYRASTLQEWKQRDSFHSNADGSANASHIARDTGVDRVLVSDDFVYFGGYGPAFPPQLRNFHGLDICKHGIGQSQYADPDLIREFEFWLASLHASGYEAAPFEWRTMRKA